VTTEDEIILALYMERNGSINRVYFAICLMLSAPDFTK
jgi:hypothetical protein